MLRIRKIVDFSIIAASFLMACNSPKDEAKEVGPVPENISEMNSTEYDFPELNVPEGYFTDKFSYSDTLKGVDYRFDYIKSSNKEEIEYNRAMALTIVNEIDKSLSWYGTEKHPDYCPVYTEVYKPVKFNTGKKFISTLFVNDSNSGGVHHNYSWYALNYSKKDHRILWCKDVFKFQNKKDSMDFKRMIGRNLDENQIDLSEDLDSVGFYFSDNGIEVYPNLGWSNGMHGATLTFDSLRPFLTKTLVQELDLK